MMNTFGVVLLSLALAGVSIPQDSETPPNVAILKFGVRWKSKTVPNWAGGNRLPSGGGYVKSGDAGRGGGRENPNLSREERAIQDRQQQADIEKSRQAGSGKSAPQEQAEVQDGYEYSISIRNTGNTTISAVEWVFVVTKTHSSDKPMEFTVYKKKDISPGKTRELSSVIASGYYLTRAWPGKNPPSFTTAAMITRIEYSDGRIWERSAVRK